MASDPAKKPEIKVVRFHRQHKVPMGDQPKGQLHRTIEASSVGFFRGNNLAVGYLVHIATSDGTKSWTGAITARVSDAYSPSEGDAWFFEVVTVLYPADPTYDETITVTVTVTAPGTNPVTSTPVNSLPDPTNVP